MAGMDTPEPDLAAIMTSIATSLERIANALDTLAVTMADDDEQPAAYLDGSSAD